MTPGSYGGKPIGERIAAAEEQLEILDREMLRMRSRIHELESDRATLKLLMEQQRRLGEHIDDVSNQMPEIARRTSEQTVALLLKDREAITTVRDDQRRDKVKVALQFAAVGIAFGALLVAVVASNLHF